MSQVRKLSNGLGRRSRAWLISALALSTAFKAIAAAPVPVQTVTGASTALSAVSATIPVGTGTDRGLVIEIVQKGGIQITGVTVGGSNAEFVKRGTPLESVRAELWLFKNPGTGSQTVTATVSGSPSELRIGVTEVTGLDQISPVNVSASKDQYIDTISQSVTTTVVDALIVAVAGNKGGATTWGPGQTSLWTSTGQGGASFRSAATPGSYTMSETANFNYQVIVVAAFKGSSGGGSTSTYYNPATDALCTTLGFDASTTQGKIGCLSAIGAAKFVFVTSETFNGNLGGRSGADAKCQASAAQANLPGTFKAWISDRTGVAFSTLSHYAGPYRLPNSSLTLVATGWAQFTANTHINPLNADATGTPVPDQTQFPPPPPPPPGIPPDPTGAHVWTDTNPNGIYSDAPPSIDNSCENWTNSASGNGDYGIVNSNRWSHFQFQSCATQARLYCVQQ